VTKEGWEEKLRHFVVSHRSSVQSDDLNMELLWLYVPDFNQNGIMSSIKEIPDQPKNQFSKTIEKSNGIYWKQDGECSGFVISNKNCHLRTDEMVLVSYLPNECRTGEIENCEDLVAYARFNKRKYMI